jgi:hypothetical protein
MSNACSSWFTAGSPGCMNAVWTAMPGTVCPRRNIVSTEAHDLGVGAGRPSLRVNTSQGMFADCNRSDGDTYTMRLIRWSRTAFGRLFIFWLGQVDLLSLGVQCRHLGDWLDEHSRCHNAN